jgi:hypothetical protein
MGISLEEAKAGRSSHFSPTHHSKMTEPNLNENLLEAGVTAAWQGHDLAPWEPVNDLYNQWQAVWFARNAACQ